MSDKDQIKDLFSEKLGGFEVKVNPELWTNIASQIGTTATTTASVGMSIATKIIIGVSAASVITVAALLISNDDETKIKETTPSEQVSDLKSNDTETTAETVVDEKEPQTKGKVNEQPFSERRSELIVAKDEGDDQSTKTGVQFTEADLEVAIIKLKTILVDSNPETSNKKDNNNSVATTTDTNQMKVNSTENLHKEDVVVASKPETKIEKIELVLPDVFTPNRDASNDFLHFEVPENVTDFQITVLNAQNRVVYQSADKDFYWDGTHYQTGDKLPAGTYVYFVIVQVGDQQPVRESSSLTIIYQ